VVMDTQPLPPPPAQTENLAPPAPTSVPGASVETLRERLARIKRDRVDVSSVVSEAGAP
jgi:hypothetical protein